MPRSLSPVVLPGDPTSALQSSTKQYIDNNFQPLDSDLSAFAALAPTNGDIVQRIAGAWANRTIAQLKTDIGSITPTAHAASHGVGQSDDLSGSFVPWANVASAGGVASLDGGTKIPIAQIPTGTSGTTVALGNAAPTAHAASHNSGGSDAISLSGIGAEPALTPTASKTSAYTAVSGDLVMADATSAGFTVTLPAASAGRFVGIKKTDSGANLITIARAGSDTIGATAATSVTLALQDETLILMASGTNWVRRENHLSLTTLDARHVLTSTKAAANGVASLDSGTKVPVAQLPTNVASGVPQLDGTGIIPTTLQYGASTSTYGIIMLAGDLGGTAALPKLIGNTLRAVTGNATVADSDGVVIITPSGSTATATLPTPVGRTGKRFIIKKAYGATTFGVSIATAAGTIDGAATEQIMLSGGYRELISDGTNWHIVGGSVLPVIYNITSPANGGTLTCDSSMANVYRTAPAVAGFILGNPTNGIDGDQINIEITPSVTFSLTITAPSLTTGITSPIAVAQNKKCFIGMRYSGSTWYVIAATVQS